MPRGTAVFPGVVGPLVDEILEEGMFVEEESFVGRYPVDCADV